LWEAQDKVLQLLEQMTLICQSYQDITAAVEV
jgi:hypothetical protein